MLCLIYVRHILKSSLIKLCFYFFYVSCSANALPHVPLAAFTHIAVSF